MTARRYPKRLSPKLRSIYKVRGIWRDQIFADGDLTPAAFKVGYGLSTYMTMSDTAERYQKTGRIVIWPSQEKLRQITGVSLDTISSSVTQLIDRGHLRKLKRGNQWTTSNEYGIVVREDVK